MAIIPHMTNRDHSYSNVYDLPLLTNAAVDKRPSAACWPPTGAQMPTTTSCTRLLDRTYFQSLLKERRAPSDERASHTCMCAQSCLQGEARPIPVSLSRAFRGAHPSLIAYLPKGFQRTAHPAVGGSGVHAQVRRCIGRGEARRLARQRRTAMFGRDCVTRDAHRALLRLQLDAYFHRSHLHYAPAVAPAHCGTYIESLILSLHHYI